MALVSTLLSTSVGESEGSEGLRFLVEGPDIATVARGHGRSRPALNSARKSRYRLADSEPKDLG